MARRNGGFEDNDKNDPTPVNRSEEMLFYAGMLLAVGMFGLTVGFFALLVYYTIKLI